MISSVFVIILTWNHIKDTIECLDSVLKTTYPKVKVIVVDNASTDKTVEIISEKYPSIILLQNQKNLGYAEGNNIGIQYASEQKADFIFILNNDTVVEPDTISLLIDDLVKNPNAIAASPKSYFYDRPEKVYFAGGVIKKNGEAIHLKGNENDLCGYTTEWLNGCAIMIRSEYLIAVGDFSADYFLLFEDVDWCLRAKRCGYDLRVVPSSKILHKASVSFDGSKTPEYIYYYVRNSNLWYERNFPLQMRLGFYRTSIKNHFKTLKNTVKIFIAYTPSYKAIRQAYFDYLFRRFKQRNYMW